MGKPAPGTTKTLSLTDSSMSRASLSAWGAWKITGTPWRTHIFTPAELEQWVATVSRRALATSITASSSRSVITVTVSSACIWPQSRSPETLTLIVSTPSRAASRAAFMNSSAPSAATLKRKVRGKVR